MKTIKLLLVAVFCFAIAVPAMAQKVAAEKKDKGEYKTLPAEEAYLPAEEAYEVKEEADPGSVFGQKKGDVAEGKLNYHEFSIAANGASGMTAEITNKKQGYTIRLEKFKDANGEIQTARYCEGNEDMCRVIAEGEKCQAGVTPKKLCYVPKVGKENPKEGYVLPGGSSKPEVMPEEETAPLEWAAEAVIEKAAK